MISAAIYIIVALVFFVGFGDEVRWTKKNKKADLLFVTVMSLAWPIIVGVVLGFLAFVFLMMLMDEFIRVAKDIKNG